LLFPPALIRPGQRSAAINRLDINGATYENAELHDGYPLKPTDKPIRLSSLSQLDKRTVAAREALDLRAAIVSDMGGESEVSAVQGVLVEQMACLSALASDYGRRWLAGELPPDEIPTWMSVNNVLRRTGETIGLRRTPKPVADLRAFLVGEGETTPPQQEETAS
jgi:hypothetical protein